MKRIFGFITAIVTLGFAFPALALTVSPARIEITGDPGTTVAGEIVLMNEQEGIRTFYSSAENFEPSGETGAPHFIGAKDGLATWIETQNQVTLATGDKTVVPFSITVPKTAEPGGYFAAIFFGTQPPQKDAISGGEVAVGGKIGVLVLLRVSGDVPEKGGLVGFETKEKKRFFTQLPVSFVYRLNNAGGDRIVPQGNISIKNSFWLTAADLPANKGNGSALPNSTRRFDAVWGNADQQQASDFWGSVKAQTQDFHIGLYTARLSIVWGEAQHVERSSFVFFVFPWQLMVIVFGILLILGPLLWVAIRKYNAFIIAQAVRQK